MVRVTKTDIDRLILRSTITTKTVHDKCTVVTVKLENGFVLVESSACVDQKNYDEAVGYRICLDKIEDKLWELEGFRLQHKEFENKQKEEKERIEKERREVKSSLKPGDLAEVVSNEYMYGVGLHEYKRGTIIRINEVVTNSKGEVYYRTQTADGKNVVRNAVPYWDVKPVEDSKKHKLQPGDLAEVTGDSGHKVIGNHIYSNGEQVRILEKLNVGHTVDGEKYYKVAANTPDNKAYGWYVLEKDLKKLGGK